MKLRLARTIILIMSLIFGNAVAVEYNGGFAGAFLRMGLGARAVAMGNSGVARPMDGFALYYNPASLAYQEHRSVAISYSFLPLDRQFHFVGITIPIKPSAGLSIGWIHAGVKNIEGRNSAGYIDEVYNVGEEALMLAFANAIHPKLSFGLNFKILRQQMVDLTASGIGFDFGVLYTPFAQLRVGLQFKDIGANYSWNTQKLFQDQGTTYREAFPQIVKFGVAVIPHRVFAFNGDLELSDQGARQAHFGVEYNYRELAFLRVGMNGHNPTFGAGLAYGFIRNLDTALDYCYVAGAEGEGASHIFAWQFKF